MDHHQVDCDTREEASGSLVAVACLHCSIILSYINPFPFSPATYSPPCFLTSTIKAPPFKKHTLHSSSVEPLVKISTFTADPICCGESATVLRPLRDSHPLKIQHPEVVVRTVAPLPSQLRHARNETPKNPSYHGPIRLTRQIRLQPFLSLSTLAILFFASANRTIKKTSNHQ